MTNLTNEDLIKLNHEGLIPGPNENEEEFRKRADYCLKLKDILAQDLEKQFNLEKQDFGSEQLVREALPSIKKFFDIDPTWIPIFFSNYKLSPWHGGCAWIFQLTNETPMAAFFQLRQTFRKSRKYLGLYDREELIAHELCHVGRMMFQEPKYEEIIAYRTSKSWFRRWFGPIVQNSWESMLFLVVLLLILVMDFALAGFDQTEAFELAMWFKLIPIALIIYALVRLVLRQDRFSKCLHNVLDAVGDENKANAVVYRLQDKEINLFSRMRQEEIRIYATENAEKSLRWRLLKSAYF